MVHSDLAQSRAMEVAQELVETGIEVGLQATAFMKGECVVDIAAGIANRETGDKVNRDTLFNVYSVTKAVTATCVHILVDRGQLSYDDLVVKYWPEYGVNGKESTTISHVIAHRSGVPQMPEGIGPEDMADSEKISSRIAELTPVAPPGAEALYQPLTHGWLIGEIVRRADPEHRTIDCFIREEIAEPLNAPDLWVGLPDELAPRVAKLVYDVVDKKERPPLNAKAMPEHLALKPSVFERPDVRRAVVPAVGGVFNARSCGRFWAMLANGGELDGVRLLSPKAIKDISKPREKVPDLVMYGRILPLSDGGFWLGMENGSTAAALYERVICHPGAGNSFGLADPETGFAFAFCHNRMYQPQSREQDGVSRLADAIRDALDL